MKRDNPSEKSFLFWQQWLFYSSLIFAAFGVVLAVYGDNPLFGPYHRLLAEIFLGQPAFPDGANAFRAMAMGPLGGTIACCYLLLAFIARYPFRNKERWARNAIVAAFGTWFLIDSAICLYYGVYAQVYAINLFSLLQKALPLIFTWNHFNNGSSM
jgi:hypothetical protein